MVFLLQRKRKSKSRFSLGGQNGTPPSWVSTFNFEFSCLGFPKRKKLFPIQNLQSFAFPETLSIHYWNVKQIYLWFAWKRFALKKWKKKKIQKSFSYINFHGTSDEGKWRHSQVYFNKLIFVVYFIYLFFLIWKIQFAKLWYRKKWRWEKKGGGGRNEKKERKLRRGNNGDDRDDDKKERKETKITIRSNYKGD